MEQLNPPDPVAVWRTAMSDLKAARENLADIDRSRSLATNRLAAAKKTEENAWNDVLKIREAKS